MTIPEFYQSIKGKKPDEIFTKRGSEKITYSMARKCLETNTENHPNYYDFVVRKIKALKHETDTKKNIKRNIKR
jgi:hypothetical protein